MDKSQIIAALELAMSEAQELGMDTQNYKALLEKLRDGWDGLEEYMKE